MGRRRHGEGALFYEEDRDRWVGLLELPPDGLQEHERRAAGERWQQLDLVFPTNVGTPMSPSNLRRDLARLTVAAGLGRWSPNELRHSAASLLSASAVPLEQIADVLGHTDTRMLVKHYRHPIARTIDAAAARMERLFGDQEVGP